MIEIQGVRLTAVRFSLLLACFSSVTAGAQLPPRKCDFSGALDCAYSARIPTRPEVEQQYNSIDFGALPEDNFDNRDASSTEMVAPEPPRLGFHWRRALTESLTFLVIEQAYVVHTDSRWVVSENGVPFNHYWRDYTQSLSAWIHSGWNDGDPNWFGYVGHPVQGALTGFIQIQNDPRSEKLEFSKTKEYWRSRFKAFLWNAAYSTLWNLGPLSEVTVEKYGTKTRGPWNYNGTYPCFHHCLTGVGQIDIVMTPLGGTGWLIGEDFLDKELIRRVEDNTGNHFLIDTVRVALNPIRAAANVLHGEHPWYRASRDFQKIGLLIDEEKGLSIRHSETAQSWAPSHGDLFLGYTYMGGAHCEQPLVGAIVCDPVSARTSNLSGWSTSVEKKYLRYLGAVADFGAQYGAVRQMNYLFGLRGGASISRLRPFAQALFGAIRTSTPFGPNTSFAEDLGAGADFQMTRALGWRNQVDVIKTSSPAFERYNLRLTSGFVARF